MANDPNLKSGHDPNLKLKKGDSVHKTTKIGIVGNTGKGSARHLHFEFMKSATDRSKTIPTFDYFMYDPDMMPKFMFYAKLKQLQRDMMFILINSILRRIVLGI